MTTFDYTIKDAIGIHARPASMLVKFVSEFTSEIEIKKNDKTADAKGLFSIMSLGAVCGDKITFELLGDKSEEEALKLEGFCNEIL